MLPQEGSDKIPCPFVRDKSQIDPASLLSTAKKRLSSLPKLDKPRVNLPGFDFAALISSSRVLKGEDL